MQASSPEKVSSCSSVAFKTANKGFAHGYMLSKIIFSLDLLSLHAEPECVADWPVVPSIVFVSPSLVALANSHYLDGSGQ